MTTTDLIATCREAGIVITTDGTHIDVEAPADRLTTEIRQAIRQRKPELLAILWRLEGMRRHPDPIPTAKSAREAPGGPGRCFSCGDPHEHPEAYGRCVPCSYAVELYYAEHGTREAVCV